MQAGLLLLFWVLSALVLFTTLAPLTNSVQWWVRGWDFPRVHIAGAALLVAVLGFYLANTPVRLTAIALIGCALYQAYHFVPYTPLVRPEVTLAPATPAKEQVSILAVNVLMENTDHDRLRALIDREDPDVIFLMETDQTWIDAVEDQLARYETVLRHPLSNYYGAVFATRLPTTRAEMVFLSDDDTPAVLAQLTAPTGDFFFVGLHPKPPVPGTDTEARDDQIKRSAQIADRTILPVVAMGDFNDVAWSWTTQRFKDYGDFHDPRVGRGILPSFDAKS